MRSGLDIGSLYRNFSNESRADLTLLDPFTFTDISPSSGPYGTILHAGGFENLLIPEINFRNHLLKHKLETESLKKDSGCQQRYRSCVVASKEGCISNPIMGKKE